MGKKRIFIGIAASRELSQDVAKFENKYKDLINPRWIKKKNLHITLIPPWYEESINEVVEIFRRIKLEDMRPFALRFTSVEYGPTKRRPRLIWTNGETPKFMVELKKQLESEFNKVPEKREFLIHMTIARFKEIDFRNYSVKEINEKVYWEMDVNKITLFESRLLRSGAEYKKIADKEFYKIT